MVHYVAGLMFDCYNNVALILKNKPAWQKDKYNAIGGKIESTDASPKEAMIREFLEETGFQTKESDWKSFLTLAGNEFQVEFFCSFQGAMPSLRTMESEPICILDRDRVTVDNSLSNLQWIIPMALTHNRDSANAFYVQEL